MACLCLRMHLRVTAQSYSVSKYDIPKAQVDSQATLLLLPQKVQLQKSEEGCKSLQPVMWDVVLLWINLM